MVEEKHVNEGLPPRSRQVTQGVHVPYGVQGAQGDQVPIVEGGNDVQVVPPELSNSDIREALLALARDITTQANLNMVPRMNVVKSSMTSRLRDFVRMNPPIFLVSKVNEDPQKFLDGVYNVLSVMGVKSREKRRSWFHCNCRMFFNFCTLNGRII